MNNNANIASLDGADAEDDEMTRGGKRVLKHPRREFHRSLHDCMLF
jgi:hypothetical protein